MGVYKDIKESFKTIKDLANKNLNYNNYKSFKIKTFDDVRKEKNLSDTELYSTYRNYAISFYVCLVAVLYCGITVIISDGFMSKLVATSIGMVFTALIHRYSLYCYLIKHQKLGAIKEHLTSVKEWFPKI